MIQFLTSNFVTIFELAALMLMLKISVHIPVRIIKLTKFVIALLTIALVVYNVEYQLRELDEYTVFRPILTAVNYSIFPFVVFLLVNVVSREKIIKSRKIWYLIPEIISIPLYFSSQWTHIVCWYDESNHYQGGPLSSLSYWVFAFYAAILVFENYLYFKESSSDIRSTVNFIFIFPVAGMLLIVAAGVDDSYCGLFTASLVLYYLFIYIHIARTDALTGLQNRQSYYKEISSGAFKISAVVSVDMNELKYINDNLGHDAGDKALKTVSEVLQKNRGHMGTVYRIGGDEFVIFYEGLDEHSVKYYVNLMRSKMEETPYVCAFGHAMRKEGSEIEAAIRLADRRMYDDKAAIKEEMKRKGITVHYRD